MKADFIEAGAGPFVMLVHSSVAGARQWRKLMADLSDFHVRAVNLFGYGASPVWNGDQMQTLDDQARLIATALPDGDRPVTLVGHSFGGSVAMALARHMPDRVRRLVLCEPNPFAVLREAGRDDGFAEAKALRDCIKENGARNDWMTAAARFADYWGGAGTWAATPDDRRTTFAEALKPNFHEWDAVMNDPTPLVEWQRTLPDETLVISDPKTVLPIRQIVGLLRDACPKWRFETIEEGGHMAPLTRPDLVNPLIRKFLVSSKDA